MSQLSGSQRLAMVRVSIAIDKAKMLYDNRLCYLT
jgi:hypothetical protein